MLIPSVRTLLHVQLSISLRLSLALDKKAFPSPLFLIFTKLSRKSVITESRQQFMAFYCSTYVYQCSGYTSVIFFSCSLQRTRKTTYIQTNQPICMHKLTTLTDSVNYCVDELVHFFILYFSFFRNRELWNL